MKFWIDENIAFYIVNKLKQHGHEIYKAERGTDDFSILQYAIEEKAVIITYDQDFERLVLKEGKACNGIIWIRFDKHNRLEEIIAKLLRLIKVHEKKLATSFITLSLDGMYIKKLKEEGIAYTALSDEYPVEQGKVRPVVAQSERTFMADIFHNSMEEYFSIEGETHLEYYDGQIWTKGGPPIVLLGGIVEQKPAEPFIVMINNASREEVEKLAEFVAAMRGKDTTP